MRKSNRSRLTDQLKQAIADSGVSGYKLAKESEVPQPVVQRFLAGKRGISLTTADKLAAHLGLRLTKYSKTGGR
jgi:plasmid maintenance system antidote protein VapI